MLEKEELTCEEGAGSLDNPLRYDPSLLPLPSPVFSSYVSSARVLKVE
jgi:hypothetical protein